MHSLQSRRSRMRIFPVGSFHTQTRMSSIPPLPSSWLHRSIAPRTLDSSPRNSTLIDYTWLRSPPNPALAHALPFQNFWPPSEAGCTGCNQSSFQPTSVWLQPRPCSQPPGHFPALPPNIQASLSHGHLTNSIPYCLLKIIFIPPDRFGHTPRIRVFPRTHPPVTSTISPGTKLMAARMAAPQLLVVPTQLRGCTCGIVCGRGRLKNWSEILHYTS